MPTRHRALASGLVLALPLLLAQCKGASGECDPTDPLCGTPDRVPTTVTLSPTSLSLSGAGETSQLNVIVQDQNGQTIANPTVTWTSDDPSVATVSSSGLVRAEGPGGTTVEAMAGTASAEATVTVGSPCDPKGTLVLGDTRAGSLTATSCTLTDGHHVDTWTLSVPAADAGRLQIDLVSADFDAFLGLLDGQGNLVADADDSHNTGSTPYDRSAHVDQSLAAGTYTIAVTTLSAGETGAYNLYVGPGLLCPEQAVLARPSSTSGSLAGTDCSYTAPTGTVSADVYVLRVVTAATVTIGLTSTEFDAYLTLYDPAGNFIEDSDDEGGGTNALIERTLQPGWYLIEASVVGAL